MTRHEKLGAARVVPQYEIDTLGAPFKVTVSDCVTLRVDESTGKELVNIPDLNGLIAAVVRARVTHPRKLNGPEIKFIRNALGVKAGDIAAWLKMSPEHMSRCEAGTKVMSAMSEKAFRLFVFMATYVQEPEELLLRAIKGREISKEIEKKAKKPNDVLRKFAEQFFALEIESVFDASEELHFDFSRELIGDPESAEDSNEDQNIEIEWEPKLICCGGGSALYV